MTKTILLISDTHGYLDPKIEQYASGCDEIWHAGDIGECNLESVLKPDQKLVAVYGNIDNATCRKQYPEVQLFEKGKLKFLMIHIGGYPNRYASKARTLIHKHQPDVFICGHSHILKVIRDTKYNMLTMNPGAIGNHGFHKVKTMLRFKITPNGLEDLEVIEIGRSGRP